MKYAVTGGSGFIGKHLVNELVGLGHEVIVLDIQGRFSGDFKFIDADISQPNDYEKIQKALHGVDTVFHLAAKARVQPSIDHPILFDKVNVSGTLAMLELSRIAKVRRFILSSSSAVYGDTTIFPTPEAAPTEPMSPYGLQKLIGEEYCQLYSRIHDIETVCLRYFNVYGENAPTEGAYCLVIGAFMRCKAEGRPLTIYGTGQQRRDFTYVQDVARANFLAAHSDKVGAGEVINVGNGESRSVQQIANIFGEPFEYLPARLEPFETLANIDKAKELLGWSPTGDVEKWLADYLDSSNG
jgi:UDP-glucose 4-epimerase